MQNLDIISVNLWQILISLANLTILFLLLKKFLYKPVTKMLEERRAQIDSQYADAENASNSAKAKEAELTERLSGAKVEAESIVKEAAEAARARGDKIVEDAKVSADGIIRQAELDAELQRKKATENIKEQIVEVSTALAEKMLEREINPDDHKALIDDFINKLGDE
ncbi:MAG: F0F1 ATP synthase subunit B [Ruminococcaceae bacterium]|nr:F0F1 ATP synthase subunit B [Oscillospiraceae bacterium]